MTAISPFDILAETYDADFTSSAIGLLQRERVWHYLNKTLALMPGSLSILEINCGTGQDATRLAALGHTVVATDASAIMIEKANAKNNTTNLQFITCSFDDLSTRFEGQQFDLVFSNFGGLNCVDGNSIVRLSVAIHTLTKPGGKLFFVLLSDRCIWEIIHYSCKISFYNAFRRFGKTAAFKVQDATIPVYYYSPLRLQQLFAARFMLQQKYPVGLFIPPSYLEKKFAERPKQLNRFSKWENKFGYSFLSRYADHFCSIFIKPIHQ